ncbi:MAG: SUMF1/EgtB/PvdO family nonheme iron enzyme [Candidatus Omnitrophota bacterium]
MKRYAHGWLIFFLMAPICAAQAPTPTPILGDLNNDGAVDSQDLMILMKNWHIGGQVQPTPTPIDYTGQSVIIPLPNLVPAAKPLAMARIPHGEFVMGSPDGEVKTLEKPQHSVKFAKDFYMGKYEVTQAQWRAVMGSELAWSNVKGDDYPAYFVSWDLCQRFLEKMNTLGVGAFRLPTEAEWEYACRAGTTSRFYWGDDADGTLINNYAWYSGNNKPDDVKQAGLKLPNPWGLFDMSGNVYEWCEDDWHDYYTGAPQNGSAWVDSPRAANRVYRGGYYGAIAQYCRSAYRYPRTPDFLGNYVGFRLVMPVGN